MATWSTHTSTLQTLYQGLSRAALHLRQILVTCPRNHYVLQSTRLPIAYDQTFKGCVTVICNSLVREFPSNRQWIFGCNCMQNRRYLQAKLISSQPISQRVVTTDTWRMIDCLESVVTLSRTRQICRQLFHIFKLINDSRISIHDVLIENDVSYKAEIISSLVRIMGIYLPSCPAKPFIVHVSLDVTDRRQPLIASNLRMVSPVLSELLFIRFGQPGLMCKVSRTSLLPIEGDGRGVYSSAR